MPVEFLRAEYVDIDAIAPAGVRRAAVLGSPIAHSLSPALHRAAYASLGLTDLRYDRFEVDDEGLEALLAPLGPEWVGFSCTMPLKRRVIELSDEVTPLAAATGAANTLVFRYDHEPGENGRVWRRADNTDVQGVIGALGDAGVFAQPAGRETTGPAAILGGGATAASAVAALGELGWREVALCVRSFERAADVVAAGESLGVSVRLVDLAAAVSVVAEADVVIGTVPGGALGELADQLHVGTRADGHPAVLLDAIYDPWPTPIASSWLGKSGLVVSGRDMLIHQAVGQVEQFTGLRPEVKVLRDAGS